MNVSAATFTILTALIKPDQRSVATQQLARMLGTDELIIFLKDPQLDLFLPGPGFPQTLPGGRAWQTFLRECVAQGTATGELRSPATRNLSAALGIVRDDYALIVLGPAPSGPKLDQVLAMLPFVCAAFRAEQQARNAEGNASVARESAQRATVLAKALDQTRRELQHALTATEKALKVRDEFLSLAAHELKTPVTALQGYLQLVQRRFAKDYDLSPRDSRTLQTLTDQVRRLNRLIGSLFDLSRIQTGRFSLECQPFDVVVLVARIVEDLTPTLVHHQLTLTVQEPAILINADIVRLEQVIYNLILNAIKYSPNGGTIHLTLVREEESVCIRVSDQGIGIPQQALPHLFTQFYRADNARSQEIKGMGIGLYVVNEIITAHNGHITVDSVEDKGTTFTICLPDVRRSALQEAPVAAYP